MQSREAAGKGGGRPLVHNISLTHLRKEREKEDWEEIGTAVHFQERLMGSLQASYPLEESAVLPALSCLSTSTSHSQSLAEEGVTLVWSSWWIHWSIFIGITDCFEFFLLELLKFFRIRTYVSILPPLFEQSMYPLFLRYFLILFPK